MFVFNYICVKIKTMFNKAIFIIFFYFLITSNFCNAQFLPIAVDQSRPEVDFIQDNNGNRVVRIKEWVSSKYNYHFNFLDEKGTVKRKVTSTLSSSMKYVGSMNTKSSFIFFYKNTYDSENIAFYVLNKSEDNNNQLKTLNVFNSKDEKFIQAISSDNHFIYITYTKESDELNFYVFKEDLTFKKSSIPINFKKAYKKFKRGFTVFYSSIYNNIYNGSSDKKIFISDEKLTFIFDESSSIFSSDKEGTRLLTYDFVNNKVTTDTFLAIEDEYIKDFSSYYFDNKVYRAVTDSNFVMLQIFDDKGTFLNESKYHTTDDSFDFCANTVTKQSGMSKPNVITGSKNIVRQLRYGLLSLTCSKVSSNETMITIGSYVERKSGGVGYGFGINSFMSACVSISFNNDIIRYSNLLIDNKTNKVIPLQKPLKNVGDINRSKIQQLKDKGVKPKNFVAFQHEDDFYISYYSKPDKSVYFEKLEWETNLDEYKK